MSKTNDPTKFSVKDFETLLDNYEHWVRKSAKPGNGTCNHALHEARQALINAAKLGVDDVDRFLTPARYRAALVTALTAGVEPMVEPEPGRTPEQIITIGLRCAPTIARAKPSEVEKILVTVREEFPEVDISATHFGDEKLSYDRKLQLRYRLRQLGEQIWEGAKNGAAGRRPS